MRLEKIMKNGVIQQVGTPEEILRQPATDYIAEFVQDVNKLQVIRCKGIMAPYEEEKPLAIDLPRLRPEQSLGEALQLLAGRHKTALVLDEQGRPCGVISEQQILDVLIHGLDQHKKTAQ